MKSLWRLAFVGMLCGLTACGGGTTEVPQELTPEEQQSQQQHLQRVQQMEQQMGAGATPGQAPTAGSLPAPGAPANP